jgi:hypothetical protein
LLELQDGAPHHLRNFRPGHHGRQGISKATDRPRMQLGNTRLVDADFGADLLHGGLAVVVEANDLLFAWR